MWLYFLKRKNDNPELDCMNSIVIRASREKAARQIAADHAGDEGTHTWLDPELSTCELLKQNGKEGVICIDFHAG